MDNQNMKNYPSSPKGSQYYACNTVRNDKGSTSVTCFDY